jgi:hypothetical protein
MLIHNENDNKVSGWTKIIHGVPQESVLGHLLLLVCTNVCVCVCVCVRARARARACASRSSDALLPTPPVPAYIAWADVVYRNVHRRAAARLALDFPLFQKIITLFLNLTTLFLTCHMLYI